MSFPVYRQYKSQRDIRREKRRSLDAKKLRKARHKAKRGSKFDKEMDETICMTHSANYSDPGDILRDNRLRGLLQKLPMPEVNHYYT